MIRMAAIRLSDRPHRVDRGRSGRAFLSRLGRNFGARISGKIGANTQDVLALKLD